MNGISKVTDTLYISGKPRQEDALFLHSKGVRAVLELTEEMDEHSCVMARNFKYLHIPAADEEEFDILPHLDTAVEFIYQNVREGSPVLVHCMMGVSRSATAILAYLIKYYGMYPPGAIAYLRTKRSIINPNPGFVTALYRYATRQN